MVFGGGHDLSTLDLESHEIQDELKRSTISVDQHTQSIVVFNMDVDISPKSKRPHRSTIPGLGSTNLGPPLITVSTVEFNGRGKFQTKVRSVDKRLSALAYTCSGETFQRKS